MDWPLLFGVGVGATAGAYVNTEMLNGKIPLPGALGAGAVAYMMTGDTTTALFSAAGTMGVDMIMNTMYQTWLKDYVSTVIPVTSLATGISASVANGIMQFVNVI